MKPLTVADVAAAYEQTLKNVKFRANVIIANGSVLNNAAGEALYDSAKTYRVTAEGITELEDVE